MTKGNLQALLLADTEDGITTVSMIDLAKQAAAGMTYLAQRKIVHRDLRILTPLGNLLVGSSENKYIVKIADFGLSRSLTSEYYTSTGKAIPVKW